MDDTKKISQPSQGTEDLGRETTDDHTGRPSAGTDTQLHIAAKSSKKDKSKNKDINDDEKVVTNSYDKEGFLTYDETDE